MQKPLTTAAKLTILEKAIEMGADVSITLHVDHTDYTPTLETTCKPFEVMTGHSASTRGYRWRSFYQDGHEDFRACVFFPMNHETPKEWKDAGDMGEGSAQ